MGYHTIPEYVVQGGTSPPEVVVPMELIAPPAPPSPQIACEQVGGEPLLIANAFLIDVVGGKMHNLRGDVRLCYYVTAVC